MDHPIFKLEKVVQPKTGETLEDFEGPLDLILFLLNKNKIEIQDIPIALILDQYLAYLEQRKQMDLEVASEFVTMAAHLMYIKTRMLLSIEDEEAQSEMDALIQSLAERQRGDAYARIRKLPEGTDEMQEMAGIIRDGASTFLKTEFRVIAIVVIVVAAVFGLFVEKTSGITFIMGASMSSVVCILGIIIELLSPDSSLFWSFFALNLVMLLLSYAPVFPAFLRLREIDPDSERPFRVPGGRGLLRALAYVPMALILISIFFTAVPLSMDSETLSHYLPITVGSLISIAIGEVLIAARARRRP